MKYDDVRERKGDRILYQLPRRCEHPLEWCQPRCDDIFDLYYYCYKCNTSVSKDEVNRD